MLILKKVKICSRLDTQKIMSNFPWESKALLLKVWSTETLSGDPIDYSCFYSNKTLFAIFTIILRCTVFFRRLHDVLYDKRLRAEADRESSQPSSIRPDIRQICKNVNKPTLFSLIFVLDKYIFHKSVIYINMQ